ncbi:MAG: 30S ribosomal protein S1 [Calditrichia bacterium]
MSEAKHNEMEQEIPFQPGQVVKPEDLLKFEEDVKKEKEAVAELYEKNLNKFESGQVVKARVLEITDTDVIVDLGFKSEGEVPKEEFYDINSLKEGDEIEVYMELAEDLEGNIQVSRRRVEFLNRWDALINSYEKKEVIQGRIIRRIKGGFVVDLGGVDAFLPGSQIDVKPIRDFDAFVGKTIDVRIVKVNEARKNIVVSRRVLVENEMSGKRDEILKTLEKGQVRKGIVKNVTDFGVFVDLGGVDGLLHITDLSWGRVNHPSEVVKLDEEIEVVILDFDKERKRISLGRKQLEAHPWEKVEEKYPIGQVVSGKVVSLTDYGAFVELEKGIEGLIHISEMSWSQHIKHPSQVLSIGQDVEAKVLSIEAEDRKISLGLKQLQPDPWESIEEKYPIDSQHKGIVRNITPFGVFVELEEGVDGLVHISDLSWTKKIRHPNEVVKKGEELEVKIIGINKEERRIALGVKQIEENPWDTFETEYAKGKETKGKIVRFTDKGAIVQLPLGVETIVNNKNLGHPKILRAADFFKINDELPFVVVAFDKEKRKIDLSVNDYFKGKDEEYAAFKTEFGLDKLDETEGTPIPELLEEDPEAGKAKKTSRKKKKADENEEEKDKE